MPDEGASSNERLLAAARTDNEDLLLEIFESKNFNINYQDGLGNTALHYAVSCASTEVLEYILFCEGCDVDPINRLEKATPLHLAVRIHDPDTRLYIINSLLEAGADMTIKDKNGDTFLDLIPPGDTDLRELIRKSQAEASVSRNDIAYDDDDFDEPGSGSDED